MLQEKQSSHRPTAALTSPTRTSGDEGNWCFSGTLLKYTNVMKGWQSRIVTVDCAHQKLSYFVPEDRNPGKTVSPRATVDLVNCVVVPSDEDSVSFSISLSNGENIKFRAVNAKDRQQWVDRVRQASNTPPVNSIQYPTKILRPVSQMPRSPKKTLQKTDRKSLSREVSASGDRKGYVDKDLPEVDSVGVSSFDKEETFEKAIQYVDECHKLLNNSFEALPTFGIFGSTDKDILSLKSVSLCAVLALHDCMSSVRLTRKQSSIGHVPHIVRLYRSIK